MRYFFDLHDGVETRDEEGRDCADLAAARHHAIGEAIALAVHAVKEHRHLVLGHSIVVRSETGETVATILFRDVVDVRDDR